MKQMMKWAVLALLLVCCVSTLWGCGAEKKEPTPPAGTTDVPDLDHPDNDGTTQTVVVEESVVFNSGDLTLRFVKNAQDKWVWKEDVSFPLQQSYVTDILSAAQEILASTPLDAAAAAGDHGFDSSSEFLTVTNDKSGSTTFYFGNLTADGRYYVRYGTDAEKVYLAPAKLTELLKCTIYDMAILPELPQLELKNLRSITVADKSGKTVTVHADESGKWVNEAGTSVTMKINAFSQVLPALQIRSCADYNPSSGAAGICGLSPANLSVTIDYVNSVGSNATMKLAFGNAIGDQSFVLFNEGTTIYRMDTAVGTALSAFLTQE